MPAELLSHPVAWGTLTDYTRAGLVVPTLKESSAPGVIKELSQHLHHEGCVPDLLPLYQAALNQELLNASTAECGVAFPHARLSAVKKLAFAFGRLGQPIPWGSRGSAPVEFVFLLAVPATDAAQYLHLLGALARLGQRRDLLSALRTASSPELVLQVLAEIPVRKS